MTEYRNLIGEYFSVYQDKSSDLARGLVKSEELIYMQPWGRVAAWLYFALLDSILHITKALLDSTIWLYSIWLYYTLPSYPGLGTRVSFDRMK